MQFILLSNTNLEEGTPQERLEWNLTKLYLKLSKGLPALTTEDEK